MMNEIFTILDQVMEKNPFRIYPDKGALVIREKAERAGGKFVTLKTSGKTFAFSLDQDEDRHFRVFPFFNASAKGVNTKNDGIIFCRKNGQVYALLIELKSKRSGKYLMQLKSARNFVNFLISTIHLHYSIHTDVVCRAILFDTNDKRRSPRKGLTKRRKMVFDKVDGLDIARLRCNETYYLAQFLE